MHREITDYVFCHLRALTRRAGQQFRLLLFVVYLIVVVLLAEQLPLVPPGLVQSVFNGQLAALHLVHDAQLHLIAQLQHKCVFNSGQCICAVSTMTCRSSVFLITPLCCITLTRVNIRSATLRRHHYATSVSSEWMSKEEPRCAAQLPVMKKKKTGLRALYNLLICPSTGGKKALLWGTQKYKGSSR